MLWRAIIIWLILVVLAVINGITRNALISPRFGEHSGHIISTIILCVAIFVVSIISIRWIAPKAERDALLIGILWVLLTVAFEFIAGHYLFGNSWEKLFADYNILRGRIWVLVLIASLISPLLAAKVKGLS
ncbi:MAG: hypothetical protein JSV33_05875 [bacterium]|nr:MAG: hypothetical protein JSV33_05875 [bacterium]